MQSLAKGFELDLPLEVMPDDRAVLHEVWQTCELRDPERLSPLLHLQAVIGHKNDKTWYDVHPVLIPLIANEKTAAV